MGRGREENIVLLCPILFTRTTVAFVHTSNTSYLINAISDPNYIVTYKKKEPRYIFRIKDARVLRRGDERSEDLLQVSADSDWEKGLSVHVHQVPRHHLLRRGVSEGRLGQARVELCPRHGQGDPGEGSGHRGR